MNFSMKFAFLFIIIFIFSDCAGGYYTPEYQRAQSNYIVSESMICGNYETHYREILTRCRAIMSSGPGFLPATPTALQNEIFHDTKSGTFFVTTGGFVCDVSDVNGQTRIIERHADYRFFRNLSNVTQEYISKQPATCP